MNDITAIFAFLKYCLGSKEDMSRVIRKHPTPILAV